MSKWIFVEETFSDRNALSRVDLIKKKQPEVFTTQDQLSVIVSRSKNFGKAYCAALGKARKVDKVDRSEVTKKLAHKISSIGYN